MREFKEIFKKMSNFDRIFAIVFAISLISIQLITGSTPISLICGILGICYVVLVRLQHRYSMIFGIIQAVIYCTISFKAHIFGDFMLNTYNIIFMSYGYVQWSKNENKNGLEIIDLNKKQVVKLLLCMSLVYITMVVVLKQANGFNFYLDGLTATLSMTGLFLMSNRYRQNWIVWNINNTFHMILWITLMLEGNKNAPVMISLFGVYLINSIVGTIQWYGKKNKKN